LVSPAIRSITWELQRGSISSGTNWAIPASALTFTNCQKGWRFKGNIKGDAVKRLDPTQGPLTDNELRAFNEAATRLFDKDEISLAELGIALLTSNTGRRPIQITHMKNSDLNGNAQN